MTFIFLELVAPFIKGLIEFIFSIIADFIVGFMINLVTYQFEPTSMFFFRMLGDTSSSSIAEALEQPFYDIFIVIAVILTLSIFVYHIVVIGLGNLVEQKHTALMLIERLILFAFPGIMLSRLFLCSISDLAQDLLTMLNIDELTQGMAVNGSLGNQLSEWNYFSLIVYIFLDVIIFVEFIKLLLEVIEKYFLVMFMNIASPITFGFLVSKTTSDITRKFFSMYLSQQFLLIMNRFFLIGFCKIVGTVTLDNKIITLLATITYLKFAQNVDSHMKSMGLTVAQTGGSLIDSCLAAGKALSTMAGLGKTGLNIAGNALQKSALASPNGFKQFQLGSNLKNFAKNGLAFDNTVDKTLRDFGAQGGFAKADAQNVHLQKSMSDILKSGRYQAAAETSGKVQTEALKNLLGQKQYIAGKNGQPGKYMDTMQKAFGYDASNITSATIDKYGNIYGTMKTAGGMEKDFKFSVNANGKEGTMCDFDGKTRYAESIGKTSLPNDFSASFEYTDGGMSNLSTLTGMTFDDERISSLGTQSFKYQDGIITGYQNDDVCTFKYDTNTNSMLYNPANHEFTKEIKEEIKGYFEDENGRFRTNPQIGNGEAPIPGSVDVVKGTNGKGIRVQAEYAKTAQYQDGYMIIMESAEATNFEGKFNTVDLGKQTGSFTMRKLVKK